MSIAALVDNDDVARCDAETALRSLGYEVVALSTGRLVVEGRLPRTPDLLLTEIFMPPPDGLEVIRAARAFYPSALVVAMTGGAMGIGSDAALKWARALGADFLLRKPLELKALGSSLAS